VRATSASGGHHANGKVWGTGQVKGEEDAGKCSGKSHKAESVVQGKSPCPKAYRALPLSNLDQIAQCYHHNLTKSEGGSRIR
jgi:hypothetical protein